MFKYIALTLAIASAPLPAAAAVLTLDTGWQSDNLSAVGPTDNSPWTFTIATAAHFSLTDCCVAGDTWTLAGDINGVSSVGAGANDIRADGTFFGVNWLNPALGKFTKYVGPGTYTFRLTGDGAGGIPAGVGLRLDSTVPEPASWAMLIVGFGLVGATMRRRAMATA